MDDRRRLLRAAQRGLLDTVKALLDGCVSPDSEDESHTRPLHFAAYAGALPVVQLLVARGAAIDPRDDTHEATPIYWAWYGQRHHVVDFLAPLSRDVWALVPAGHVARIREVLAAEPRLARVSWEGGTPLFNLPDDEEAAAEIVRLFLAAGADAGFARKDGTTAATIAKARGLTIAGDLLSRS
jgi:ankyrin repeat protein